MTVQLKEQLAEKATSYLRKNYTFGDKEQKKLAKKIAKKMINVENDNLIEIAENVLIAHVRHTRTTYDKKLKKLDQKPLQGTKRDRNKYEKLHYRYSVLAREKLNSMKRPKVKKKVTDTSIEAYRTLENKDSRKEQLFRAIEHLGEASDLDLVDYLDWPVNIVTGRRNDLKDMERVEIAFKAKSKWTGKKVIYWKIADDK